MQFDDFDTVRCGFEADIIVITFFSWKSGGVEGLCPLLREC